MQSEIDQLFIICLYYNISQVSPPGHPLLVSVPPDDENYSQHYSLPRFSKGISSILAMMIFLC